MLRFILNFIIFGMIFFLIWKFQPEWIETMRGWAETVYDLVVDLGSQAIEKIQSMSDGGAAGSAGNGGGAPGNGS